MPDKKDIPHLKEHNITDKIIGLFLRSNLSLVLIILASLMGLAALYLTPREEDPQIIVPLADVYVNFPGHSATEVEQLVTTPLEKILYQIDGVEYVYSMSRENQAVITVRYYVGEDRERSLVKLFKKMDENLDIVPPGVADWIVKPVEIDDVPIVTLTLSSRISDDMNIRRVAEEVTQHLSAVKDVSRAYVIGGRPRVVQIMMDPDRMSAYHVSPLELQRSLKGANLSSTAGDFRSKDNLIEIEVGQPISDSRQLRDIVVGVFDGRPVFLKDVAEVSDGPDEVSSYVRYGHGPAKGFTNEENFPGTSIGKESSIAGTGSEPSPAVTIAIAKKKGANAVRVATAVLEEARHLKESIVPGDIEMTITRNYGLTADEKVNELVWGLVIAIIIIVVLLTFGLGWREALIVALAVPVVFGLTLAINLLFGFTINRVTLFALILALGLLVDDPIVDVENIARHFSLRKKATRRIVLDAVSEIRPPLIIATLAVIVSFLPLFFITGMMGPYMRPMALNVPVTMLMSMLVAFTITPWLSFHLLKSKYADASAPSHDESDGMDEVKRTRLYKIFNPLMEPLIRTRKRSLLFLAAIIALTACAMSLTAFRSVPLKMLPFDNKNELLLVLDFDEGTTLERTDAAVREFESFLSGVPEIADYTSYVGLSSPMDFNGLVRHYYLRKGDNIAEIRIDLAGKKNRSLQSHGFGLRIRNELQKIADKNHARMKIVETPPGPPVIASVVAEVYGKPYDSYEDLLLAADTIESRLSLEPGVVDVDNIREAPRKKFIFVTDKEKAALNGISTEMIADTLKMVLSGTTAGIVQKETERNPLRIELRIPVSQRTSASDLSRIYVKGDTGHLVPLSELGKWETARVDQQIYHKNLKRVAYVFAETAGRPPADVVVDVQSDRMEFGAAAGTSKRISKGSGWIVDASPRPVSHRTFLSNGSGIKWAVPGNFKVTFSGEGEWKITLDVFRDLGLAFGAALIGIYILLVAQTSSFTIPAVMMAAIPLTVLGVMPGFWLLNLLGAQSIDGYLNPVYFTATGMIGMIALSGIVTRNSIILVDFIHASLSRGRTLSEAIMESCVVRMRPILLTASAAMLGAVPIIIDPIFSGLAWALIFGLFASTIFTLFVIPVTYWLLYANKPGHGMPEPEEK
ncbi:MAG TPA: AcrB/AcrD/AcrF family protein [Lentisphaeria bacterium]|nr:MAG: acriflavine resistance protein B [Lentisphaerae bacterium GWF2_49_21]HBC87184.1 AcrB/AcrD/AcrF family protein [Lentisphaeria bacterium]